jgi:transcriptional antiterminator RfaH
MNDLYTPRWYAVQTRPQQEQKADENLLNQDFSTLFPREEVYISRNRIVTKPYFSRYLFAQFPLAALRSVRSTRGVYRVVEFVPGHPVVVEDEIIAEMASHLDGRGIVMSEKPRFKSGYEPNDLVMVTYGPLAGIAGLFRRDAGDGERVILLLKMLGREFERPFDLRDTRRAFEAELAYA